MFPIILFMISNLRTIFHPYQPNVVYIEGFNNINSLNDDKIYFLKKLFESYPLIIIKNIQNINHDNIISLLSPFDNSSYNHTYIYKSFDRSDKYEWKSDMLTSIVSSIYLINESLVGGGIEFISTENIYNYLNNYEKIAAKNMLINYNNFKLPLVFQADSGYEKYKILLLPTLFQNVSGWNLKDSNRWMKHFMYNKVLPLRFNIQLKKNDLCIFNNRRLIYSYVPYSKYLSNRGFFLYSSILTNKSLSGIKPNKEDIYSSINAAYNCNWINSRSASFSSFKEFHNYYNK